MFQCPCSVNFVEELGSNYFQITNPNASAKCGCGNWCTATVVRAGPVSLLKNSPYTWLYPPKSFIFTKNFRPYLLEINKDPELKYINYQDLLMKEKLIKDIFDKINFIKYTSEIENDFYQII